MNDILEILDKLVAFKTISALPNVEMVAFIEKHCSDLGAQCTRIPGETKGKIGLVARFGPDAPGGILLSGHCDVVPVTGQDWQRPAFQLTREGDRLFGRGTTDMKGFLACMMAAGKMAAARKLKRPLRLIFSYDEEIGCVGIQEMAPALPSLLGNPRLCIVGEPTEMAIATGHKGKAALRASCTGQNGHSALAPRFVNALHLASDFVTELRAVQDWYACNGARDDIYDVPYTTLHVGVLQGGSALNIVPEKAEVTFEYRYLPADELSGIIAKIEAASDKVVARYRDLFVGAAIKLECYNSYPGLELAQATDAARYAQSLAPDAQFTKVAFGTEAGVLTALGIPTVVCGPGSMIGQGHKPDEYVELSQLTKCQAMLGKAIEALS